MAIFVPIATPEKKPSGLPLVDLRARSYAESTLGVECIPGASHLAVLSLSENVNLGVKSETF